MSLSERISAIMTPHAANWFAGEEPWSTIYGLPLRLAAAGIRASTRAGAVRVGFHLYNTEEDLQRLLDALAG